MNTLSEEEKPSTSTVTGPMAETLCAEIASHMAIASPKTKEELVRQFRFNPEVDTRLEAFMKAEPGLVQFVKELPREQLERKFLLRKMRDQQQKHGYDAKVKAWLEKPEQADLAQEPQGYHQPGYEARNKSRGTRQSGQELHPQHRHQNQLTPPHVGFPPIPAPIQF